MRTLPIILCAALCFSLNAQAEVLRIPISEQGSSPTALPLRGEQQAQVIQQFGQPVKRHASVGNPPITRWDYADFSVYFESTTVVNSVKNHQPRHAITP